MTFPTIHTGGTSRRNILEDNVKAAAAIDEAIYSIQKMEFNARDYYTQGDGAFQSATSERGLHIENLVAARAYFDAIAEHVA